MLSGPRSSISLQLQEGGKTEARPVDAALDRADGAAADIGGFLVGKAGGAHQKQRLALIVRGAWRARCGNPRNPDASPARAGPSRRRHRSHPGPRPRGGACGIRNGSRLRRIVKSQAFRFVPGSKRWRLDRALSSVSWTRSSARSTCPDSEMAKARRLGTAARSASRRSGSRSSYWPPRPFPVQLAEKILETVRDGLLHQARRTWRGAGRRCASGCRCRVSDRLQACSGANSPATTRASLFPLSPVI